MNLKLSIILLLSLSCLTFLVNCETDEFDDGVVVEDEEEVSQKKEDKIEYQSPYPDPNKFYLSEHFDDLKRFEEKWVKSEAKKDDIAEEIAKYDGEWSIEAPQRSILDRDLGLVLKSKAKHAAISSRLNKPFKFGNKPLVVQYEVTLQDGQECGGSYIKLLSSGAATTDLKSFHDKTPYTIMFGPDKCGNDIKLHFILRHVNPKNGSIEEKHSKKPKDRIEEPFKDKQPHLYKLVLKPDNTFQISVDHKVVNEGHLLKDMNPAINPPKEIDDPTDFKPESWDEREKIPDPTAIKPENFDVPPQIPDPNAIKPENWLDDEERLIPDPNAAKPEDWDDEIDGKWEPPLIENPLCENNGCGKWEQPMIANPEYKGKWRAPLIDNPNYQGKWSPRKIPNPDFFEDNDPFTRITTISAVGIELWSMSNDILFDNIVVTDDETHAYEWAQHTYDLKRKHLDKQAESFVQKMKKIVNENPWIVALLVVVIGLPVSIILYMLCSSSPKKVDDSKKTDAVIDDTYDEPQVKDRRSKLDLNEPEGETEEAAVEGEEISNQEAEEEEPEITQVTEEIKSSEPITRKRKTRKE
ncbi:hypothetical protein PVAND_010956 [Polypedilum vanderplanki]|uniref:Calnexin n=1 Tax=Polypedilum vanderplanki TaxID=319348 RepID=A0A9J6CHL7_POLVA|nr:hypothetical protein PVAND_010956 [Polypedilum vanderplanki]